MRVQSRRYQRRLKRESAYFSAFFEICNLFYTHAKVLLYRSNTISQKTLVKHFGTLFFYKRYVSFDFDPKPPTPPPQGRSRREAPLRPSSSEPRRRDCRELQSRERQALRAAATSSASMMDWPRDFFSFLFKVFFS